MKDKILFAEIAEEDTILHHRPNVFTQLCYMGVYQQIKVLIIGRMFSKFGFNEKDIIFS